MIRCAETPRLAKPPGRDRLGRFTANNPGGPGRPTGESRRTRLARAMLAALDTAGGAELAARVARERPLDFLLLLARIMPRSVGALDRESGHGRA